MEVSSRTCIGCRRGAAATELVRLVVGAGQLRAGPRGDQPGRGASIHPKEACVVAAIKSHAFARAFRTPHLVPIAGDDVMALLGKSQVGW